MLDSVGTNEFYYLDTSRNANRVEFTQQEMYSTSRNAANNAEERANLVDGDSNTYNKGFALRKALLGNSATVNCEIPLNRYSFFEALEDKLLPNTKIELNIEIESDNNVHLENWGSRLQSYPDKISTICSKISIQLGRPKNLR